ncbi:MAG: glycosyltransferase family 4 protein [Pseudomonadales bacterium]
MKILFIHQNLPAQFATLMAHYARSNEHQVVGVTQRQSINSSDDSTHFGRVVAYQPKRHPSQNIHHYVYPFEASVLNGQAVAGALHHLKEEGFVPDIVYCHPSWGEGLYVKDMLPKAKLLAYCEFYYRAHGQDCDFDPEFPITLDDELRVRTRNATHLLTLEACDLGVSPTNWQRSTHPSAFRPKIRVIHEGVDTFRAVPKPNGIFVLPNGTALSSRSEVITYTNRSLEPHRGFHRFMRALPEILRRRPNCQVVITGEDTVLYGQLLQEGDSWKQRMLREIDVDPNRVHFLGMLPWREHIQLLQVSTVHVYLTVPFVLSWSILEAMSVGAAVVGSDTAPVRDVIQHEKNGLLVDYFDQQQLVDAIVAVCNRPRLRGQLGKAARDTVVGRFDVSKSIAEYDALFRCTVGS